MQESTPLVTNDAVVLGILLGILGFIFSTASSKKVFWRKFYRVVPTVLLCYFIPSILNSAGIISGKYSQLYYMASRYLLPASLVLLTLSIDLKSILRLGPKALVMFLSGSVGIVLGGPIAVLLVSVVDPSVLGGVGADEVWRGLATIAGSWIGGGANQTAMLKTFGASPALFSQMIAVDVVIANLWLAVLLYWAAKPKQIDRLFKADSSAIEALKKRVEAYRGSIMKIPTMADTFMILGIGFGLTGIAHAAADQFAPWIGTNYPQWSHYSLDSPFFWIVVIATTGGLGLSFTKARELEGAGASRIGSVLLYILVATVGMQMDLLSIFDNLTLFLVGIVWMMVHVSIMLLVAYWIRAPFFFVAVGSQANIGGAASAPIVASAFNPSLAPVGVLLAVFGYAVGTYGAYLCGILLQMVSNM